MALSYLNPNIEDTCPFSRKEISGYLSLEEGGVRNDFELSFFRTAQISQTRLWIWQYSSDYSKDAYAIVDLLGNKASIGSWARDKDQDVEEMIEEYYQRNCEK